MRLSRLRSALALAAALVFGVALPAGATIGVAPLSVTLDAGSTSGFINVSNAEAVERTVQVALFKWEHVDGDNKLTPSNDLLLSPPIITIPAAGQRTIRFGLRHRNTTPEELAYRVIVTEVRSPFDTGRLGVAVSMRISIPLFVAPQSSSNKKPQWSATRGADGRLVVRVNDATPYHLHVTDLRVKDAAGVAADLAGPTYVLPGESHTWTLVLSRPASGAAAVEARTDDGVLSIPVAN